MSAPLARVDKAQGGSADVRGVSARAGGRTREGARESGLWPTGAVLMAALLAVGCSRDAEQIADDVPATDAAAEALNMRLAGLHELDGRSAYQPVVHRYGDRYILFVGHHAGEAVSQVSGLTETNGLSIVDVTDVSAPELLGHVPATGLDVSGTQHVQICDGSELPGGEDGRVYIVRTNGRVGFELLDVTDPAEASVLGTIAVTGESARAESDRGTRETHKIQWDCATGIGYFNGTAEGWRVTRVLQAFDLSDPRSPQHIRDFGLTGWEPGGAGPMPAPDISGLHQAFVVDDRMYLGYGSGNDGTLQILDRDRFLRGDPQAAEPLAPTPDSLRYPEVARLDLPGYWGAHTAKPILGHQVPGYTGAGAVRDFLIVPSEAGPESMGCGEVPHVVFFVDITQVDKPIPVSTFQVPAEPGGFCERGGRFGPHSVHDAFDPAFDHTLAVFSWFNAGVRVVDIRDPFQPVEVAWYVPETNANTTPSCGTIDGEERCLTAIQTNNVNIDDRGYIYAVDRAGTGLHILELTGPAREIWGQ